MADLYNTLSYNPDNVLKDYDIGVRGDNGINFTPIFNPGLMDPSALNPAAGGYLNDIQGLRDSFSQNYSQNFLNNGYYDAMKQNSGQQLTAGLDSQYARMGLSGSSAQLGGEADALRKNNMGWDNQRFSDMLRAVQGQSMLDNQGMRGAMGIQGQYGQFQDTMMGDNLSLINAQNQQAASQNQMWGQMISGGLGGLGMAAGMLL